MGSHASSPAPPEATQVLDALRRIVRFLRVSSRASESRAGVTAAQLFVLSQLQASPAPSIRALADRTMTDPSSVSVVVAKLEALGLVSRGSAANDRRRAELALTPRGRKVLGKAPELPQVRIVAALAAMPEPQRRAIAEALEQLVVAVGAESLSPRMFFEDEPRGAKKGARRGRA